MKKCPACGHAIHAGRCGASLLNDDACECRGPLDNVTPGQAVERLRKRSILAQNRTNGRRWEQTFMAHAKARGWRYRHQRPGRDRFGRMFDQAEGYTGFLDTVLVHRKHGFMIVELKTGERPALSMLSKEQREWYDDLVAAGVEVHVWREQDVDEAIRRLDGHRTLSQREGV